MNVGCGLLYGIKPQAWPGDLSEETDLGYAFITTGNLRIPS